jgi:hypothetical protein
MIIDYLLSRLANLWPIDESAERSDLAPGGLIEIRLRHRLGVMIPRLSKKQARAFAERWRLVEEIERAELRETSPARKLEQLAALMASARALGWETTSAEEVEAVRERWILLAKRFRG